MPQTADILIIGGGLYGCSVAYHLAKLGAGKVVLLERSSICSGGTGKSCGVVRTHYSIAANMAHAVESLKVFEHFSEVVGGDAGFLRTGFLVLGSEAHREPMAKVFRAQNRHGVDARVISREYAREIHPLLRLDDVEVIGYDTLSGYCDPHLATMSYAERAVELGVTVYRNCLVTDMSCNGSNKIVTTALGEFESPCVVLTAGPQTLKLGEMIGLEFPFVLSRHKVITLKTDEPYHPDWPIVKDLTTEDKLYFRPAPEGLALIGTGDHGDVIDDADALTDIVDADHISRIRKLMANRIPAFVDAQYVRGWTGAYDITPDWNPLVGAVPGYERLYVGGGFSGHGFKLAPTISEALAQTVLGLDVRVPIDMYSLSRFKEGKTLDGAYGIGSIS